MRYPLFHETSHIMRYGSAYSQEKGKGKKKGKKEKRKKRIFILDSSFNWFYSLNLL